MSLEKRVEKEEAESDSLRRFHRFFGGIAVDADSYLQKEWLVIDGMCYLRFPCSDGHYRLRCYGPVENNSNPWIF